jgi:hypothetical protein
MNLIARRSETSEESMTNIPLSLTIRPSCGIPGDYQVKTTSASLMRMLHKKTDLSFDTLKRFEGEVYSYPYARLMGVEMSDETLTEIGYFID